MATFIQGVTDTNLNPVLYTPDYSFLRYTLQKKESQYQQGLQSVSASYGALKKELSDPVNVTRRDDYLKQANSEIQKIASADLSLQQNVNSANSIYDAISTDPAIAFDSYHTGRIKSELAQMDSWAESEDMPTRKKYNKDIYDWLKRDLDAIKNGNGDINNYKKVQGRRAWAYVDAQDLINTAAKEMGYKIENDVTGQPYIVTTINGKTNRESYDMFAQSVLDANPVYQQQSKILGQARTEGIIDYYKSDPANIGLDKTQLLTKYSGDYYKQGRDRQKTYIDNLNEKLSVQQAEYTAFHTANPNPVGELLSLKDKKFADIQNFKNQIDNIKSKYQSTYGTDEAGYKTNQDKFTKEFTENPEAYFINQTKAEDVVRWSNIRSSFGTVSIKPDPAYISMVGAADKGLNTLNTIQNTRFDNQIDVEELKIKQAANAQKLLGKTATGETRKNADGTEKLPDVEYVGVSSTQVNTTTKVDMLRDELSFAKSGAIGNMTTTFGGLYLLEKMGTKSEDVSLIRQFFTKQQLTSDYKATKEQQLALDKAYKNLFAFVNLNKKDDVVAEMRDQISQNTKIDKIDFPGLLKKAVANYVPKDEQEKQAIYNIVQYDKNQSYIKEKTDALNQGVNFVASTIMKGDDEYLKKLIKKDGEGYRMLDVNDVKQWFIGLKKSYGFSDQRLEQVANAYLNGNVKLDITKPGGAPQVAKTAGTTTGYTNLQYEGSNYLLFGSNPDVLDYSQYSKLLKRINEKIPIPEFEAAVPGAVVKGSAGFVFRGDTGERMRVILASPTQDNSNIFVNESGTATGYEQVDPTDQQAIRAAIASKSNVEMMKLWVNSPINEGKQVVEVTFGPPKNDKDTNPAAGKTFYFPINVNEKSADVFKMFAELNDEFANYSTKNTPYVMDYHEASGVMAKVYADQPGSRTGTVRISTKLDPVTKQYGDNWIEQAPLPFDLNKISFTELKDIIYNDVLSPYVSSHMAYSKQIQNQQINSPDMKARWDSLKPNW